VLTKFKYVWGTQIIITYVLKKSYFRKYCSKQVGRIGKSARLLETCRAVPYPLNRQLACNMFPPEIFGMSHFFYSFPDKAEKERRSESIRSLANYERRFKRHVSLYLHLFIACIKFQFCRIHPFLVAYIILKTDILAATCHNKFY
jgi:hypothetical protein